MLNRKRLKQNNKRYKVTSNKKRSMFSRKIEHKTKLKLSPYKHKTQNLNQLKVNKNKML